MTEERQPNTGPMCEGPYCGKCGKDLSGLTCCYVPGESSYCLEHAPKTQPNTELRALTNEMLLTNFRWACKNWLKDEQYEPLRTEILRRMEKQ